MSIRLKLTLALAGLAIILLGVFFSDSFGNMFWITVVGSLLISPLWASLDLDRGEPYNPYRS